MKKMAVSRELYNSFTLLRSSFLNRADVKVFTAETNDEILDLHRTEVLDLVIMQHDLPGSDLETFSTLFRQDPFFPPAKLVIVSTNNRDAIEKCSRCRPDVVILRPVNPALLLARAHQLLRIGTRQNFRVLVTVPVQGSFQKSTFFCNSRDISATGMLIETDKKLRPGEKLTCAFELPHTRQVEATGEILRASPSPMTSTGKHQYGVKFLDMSPLARMTLENFVSDRSSAIAS